MSISTPIEISINERDVLLAVLEFLENKKLNITQVALERESGLINGKYSEDVIFLRQLIIDGQWDNALDFAEPLKESPEFDQRAFCYLITKYKYFELLCIKQEPGPLQDNDFAVEEIVECLKDLEQISPTPEDYRQLCALLTLPKLSDHVDFKGWNPSAARVECFQKVYPLVEGLLENINPKKESQSDSFSSNERLIQLIVKGIFYEACVDFCQAQALGNKKAIEKGPQFTKVLDHKPNLSAIDLSLISWLDVLPNGQFTTPFQQRSLDFKLEQLKKPKLDAQWSDQIMQTPVKPVGQFPHSMVPSSKLKFAEKMSRSMMIPKMSASYAMIESTVSHSSHMRKANSTNQMSQSTAPSVGGFVIASNNADAENLMEQSLIITKMMQDSELTKQSRPTAFDCSSGSSQRETQSSSNPSSSNVSLPSQLAQELSQSRRELDSIVAQKAQAPNILSSNYSLRSQQFGQSTLPTVPELSTPGTNAVSPVSTPSNDVMTRSRLFQEFASKKQMQQQPPIQPMQRHYSDMQRSQNPYSYEQEMMRMQITNQNMPIRPYSTTLPGQMPNYYDPAFANVQAHPSQIPRPQSYMGSPSFQQQQPMPVQYPVVARPQQQQLPSQSIQFVPLCKYEDAQAIRAVAFHPSGRYFAIGTNSKQLLVCKYPNVRNIDLNSHQFPIRPEISLSRPKQHRGSVYCCSFNASGELLATGSNDKSIRLMSFNEGCRIGAELELNIHDGTVRDLIFIEDALVSAGAGNCQISLTDPSGYTFKNYAGHTSSILGLYSWDYKSFVSCSQDKSIRFWDIRASTAVNVILPSMRTSNSPVTSVCVDPSGKLLVSGHEDASVNLFDLTAGRTIQVFRPHGDEVRTVRFSNAAFYLLSGSYDKRLIITDMRGNLCEPLTYLPVAEHSDKIIQCRWHPQDFTFLSSSADKSVVLWTLPS